jgi:BirA family biotin operon repressor/biotin-[acetyl-CoA-carboxylase] ligase
VKNIFYIKQTQSTNALSWKMNREKSLPEGLVIYTDFQSAGKGQPGNAWESSKGMNLLFSVMLHPIQVHMDELFLISQLVSVAIKNALDEYTTNITIKWPNDIYWNDKKLAGILIENSLQGNKIMSVVIGIGLNVNQKLFLSNAPNPVSLFLITGKRQNRKQLLQKICQNIMGLYYEMDKEKIRKKYAEYLYRNIGFYSFEANKETFRAKIKEVQPDGMLELETEKGEQKSFYFKEVQFIL